MGVVVAIFSVLRNDAPSHGGKNQQQRQDQQFLDHANLLGRSLNAIGDSSEPGFGRIYVIAPEKTHSGTATSAVRTGPGLRLPTGRRRRMDLPRNLARRKE
jgi:hypothetical protein